MSGSPSAKHCNRAGHVFSAQVAAIRESSARLGHECFTALGAFKSTFQFWHGWKHPKVGSK